MATSKIKIYQTVLTPSRNALVDDLEAYLNTLTPTYSNDNFQYLQLSVDLTIKIPMPQNVISNYSLGNYVRIEQDDKVWYYFLMRTSWKGITAVQVSLSIDSINTFRNDLTFSPKTTIERQHKDRLINQGSGPFIRTIDAVSEQIPTYKVLLRQNRITDKINTDWYLIYMTSKELSPDNPNNPVSCYCTSKKPVDVITDNTKWLPRDFNNKYAYMFKVDNNGYYQLVYNQEGVRKTINTNTAVSGKTVQDLKIYKNPEANSIIIGAFDSTGTAIQVITNISSIEFETTDYKWRISSVSYDNITEAYNKITTIQMVNARSISTYDKLDKSDSKIIKIIKLPYAPFSLKLNGNAIVVPNNWIYDNNSTLLKLQDLGAEFLNEKLASITLPELFVNKPDSISATALRDDTYESKKYHSDFYSYKLVYDSFVREIQLENYETRGYEPFINWTVDKVHLFVSFKPTNTINSKFAFNFDTFLTDDGGDYEFAKYSSTIDYENYLLVSRNNEETIFSNDYLNYIRTGYNYDKKAKDQQLGFNIAGAVISNAASAASIVGAATSASAGPIGWAAAVSFSVAAATSIINTIQSGITNEQNMQSKMQQLAQQSTAVVGTDDVDLLSYYNGNRLMLIKYRTKPYQQQLLADLFYYCGYKVGQMALPNLTSRYWFNFIQCKPVFTEEGITPYNDYIDDVKTRYQAGVTVYHHHAAIGTEWDWQQQYENWETTILEA